MSGKVILYPIIFVYFFLFLPGLAAYSQRDAHLDSLENAIKHAEGSAKADLMIESILYQRDKLKTLDWEHMVGPLRQVYQYSKKKRYNKGKAESAKFLAIAFGFMNEPDSNRYYLSESLQLFTELNDSINIASIYGWYAISERGDGNYELAMNYSDKLMEIAVAMNSDLLLINAYDGYSRICKLLGKFSKEEESYRKILELHNANHLNPSLICIDLARFHINHGNYKEGILYSMKADSAIGKLEDATSLEYHDKTFMQAKMKGMVARAYRLWGYYDSSLVWHRRAVVQMESAAINSNVDIPNQWEGIGAIYTQWGMYDSARYYLEKSARDREKASDWLGVGESFDGLGYMCWLLGNQEGAVNYYRKAIEMKSKVGYIKATWRMTTFKESLSVSYLRLGQAYASWDMPESALREFEKSIELCREIGYRKGEAELLVELGKLDDSHGDQELAKENFSKALQIFLDIEFKPGQADVLKSFGDLVYSAGDYKKSLDYYHQAESLLNDPANPIEQAGILHHTGLSLAKTGRIKDAITTLNKSIDQATKFKLFRAVMDGHKALSDVLNASGQNKEALRHFEVFLAMKDSINQQNTYYQLVDLESKYKAELDEKQVVLLSDEARLSEISLNWSNAILFGTAGLILMLIALSVLLLRINRLKTAQRLALIQQRLFRSRMNPGFIFHSLENIRYFVERSETTKAFDYLSDFSRLMQSILEGSRKEFIPLDKAIAMIKNYLHLQELISSGSIDYKIEVDDSLDPYETMIPPMMVQPLLEEIIGQIREDCGKRYLKIRFRNNDPTILISVEARGINPVSSVFKAKEPASFDLIRERLKVMEKKFNRKLFFISSDLKDDNGKILGMRVELEVPVEVDS